MVLKWIKWSASGKNSRRQTQHTRVPIRKHKHAHTHAHKIRQGLNLEADSTDMQHKVIRRKTPESTGSNLQQDVSLG